MTISSETRKAGPFNGNGATTAFPFTFKCFTTSDLSVIYTTALSVESTLVLDSDYTVSLNGDQNANPGGSVTYSLLATGEKLTVIGDLPYTQETDIQNAGGFYPEVFENALDKLTMLTQQIKEEVDRSVKVDVSSATTPDALLDELAGDVVAAAASATAAAASELAATNSETAAGVSAAAALVSETNAAASEAAVADTVAALAASSGASLIGTIQSGTGAVARTAQAEFRDTVKLIQYGADPTGVADSSTALINAMAALPASGGTIYAGRGDFLISANVPFTKKINLIGEGFSEAYPSDSATRFVKAATLNGTAFTITGGGCIFEKFTLDGDTGNGGDGIVVDGTRATLRNVAVFRQGNDGIRIGKDAAGGNSNVWRLDQVISRDNIRHGVNVDSNGQNANSGCATGLSCANNGDSGLYVNKSAANTFINSHLETNIKYGMYADSSSNGNIFIGGDWEGNGIKNGFMAASTSFGGTVINSVNVDSATITDNTTGANCSSWFGWQKISSQGMFGEWTPTLGAETTETTPPTYSLQSGAWHRVGNLVTAHFRVILTSKGATWAAPEVFLKGLPFTVKAGNPCQAGGSINVFAGLTTALISAGLICNLGTKQAYFTKVTVATINNSTQMTYTDLGGADSFIGCITYITSDY
jgi:hypothetical protein